MENRSLNESLPKKGEIGQNGRGDADTAAPLAHRQDFRLGSGVVRPSIRTVEGPAGHVVTEPRVMQVLLALTDGNGAVMTRDHLLRTCWNGLVVGDDSVNRAVAEVRRIARDTGAGFGIETIPRIGYRLIGAVPEELATAPASQPASIEAAPASTTRRRLLAGTLIATGAAAFGIWTAFRPRPDPRFLELMDRGNEVLRLGLPGSENQGIEFFREAVSIKPDSATAWGFLALAQSYVSDYASAQQAGVAVPASEQAARRALALDDREPNALAALAILQAKLDDWFTTEKKIRSILAIAPGNMAALDYLTALLQAAGYYRESWDVNERAIALDPLRPGFQQRRALKHWILGRPIEADRVVARAIELWPLHPYVWNARLLISAFTGQWRAARDQIDAQANQPTMMTPTGVAAWRDSLTALQTRLPADIAVAREANLAAAPQSPGLGVHAILVLSALNELDAAYSIIDGLLLRRGDFVTQAPSERGVKLLEDDPQWRQTQWLFTPATRPLRADPRFASLRNAIGLTDYWRQRGVEPDERLPDA